jgi:hypothetical protein
MASATTKKNMWAALEDEGEFRPGDKIDFLAMYPEHRLLCEALKEGRSWYDIIYPRRDGLLGSVSYQKRHISTVKDVPHSKRPGKKARKL